MPTFTVQSASKKKDVEGKHGPMQVVALTFTDGTQAEWFTKASTELPSAGSTIEGDLEDGPYGKKFKKAYGGGGFGGPRGRSPQETARIERMAAHKTAAAILGPIPAAYHSTGEQGDLDNYLANFKQVTNWLVADLPTAVPTAGVEPATAERSVAAQHRAEGRDSARGFASEEQAKLFTRLLKQAGGSDATASFITWYAREELSSAEISTKIDGLKDPGFRQATAKALATDANAWSIRTGNYQPDDSDLPAVA